MELFWIILGFVLHEGFHIFLAVGGVTLAGKLLNKHKCCHHHHKEYCEESGEKNEQ